MNMQVLEARRDASGGYKVDVSRGERIGRVSSEWFSRPNDERFLSLGELAGAVRGRAERSRTRVVESALIHVEANRAKPVKITLELPASVHRDLVDYGRLLADGGPSIEPAKLIVPMLERFMATDRGFAKARRATPGH